MMRKPGRELPELRLLPWSHPKWYLGWGLDLGRAVTPDLMLQLGKKILQLVSKKSQSYPFSFGETFLSSGRVRPDYEPSVVGEEVPVRRGIELLFRAPQCLSLASLVSSQLRCPLFLPFLFAFLVSEGLASAVQPISLNGLIGGAISHT
uniref:Uncharacterized protein n=1 Tax=Fagus sylvatica TaxID=28930 RepID=A0A2N9GI25_FAGSY